MRNYLGTGIRTLQRQKLLTVLTLIAIVLSTALVAVLGILSGSIRQAEIVQAEKLAGGHHVQLKNLTEEQVYGIMKEAGIETAGISRGVGTAKLPGGNRDLFLLEMDAKAFQLMNLPLLKGEYPTQPGEVALERRILESLGLPLEVGQVIGLPLHLQSPANTGAESTDKELRVTGILENHPSGVFTAYGFMGTGTAQAWLPKEAVQTQAIVRFNDGVNPVEAAKKLAAGMKIEEKNIHFNDWLISALGYGSEEKKEEGMGSLSVIIGGLVLLAAFLVIYNIFQVSVVQRTQQFGMLRAVGATPGQVRRLVLFEAAILCAIGIPLGLLLGTAASRLVVGSVSSVVSPELFRVENAAQAVSVVQDNMRIPLSALLGASAMGFATTLLSALFPAVLASRVPPTVAISGLVGGGITMKHRTAGKQVKNILWHNARLNLSRNRVRTYLTVLSLAMAVVTFVALGSFVQSFNTMDQLAKQMDSDYSITVSESPIMLNDAVKGISPSEAEELKKLPGVESIRTTRYGYDGAYVRQHGESIGQNGVDEIFAFDEQTLSGVLEKLGKKAPSLEEMKGKPWVLVEKPQNYEKLDLPELKIPSPGDEIEIYGHPFTVAGTVENMNFIPKSGLWGKNILMHEQQYLSLAGRNDVQKVDVFLRLDASKEDVQRLEAAMKVLKAHIPALRVTSFEEARTEIEKGIRGIRSLGYGLIILVSLIGALNIVNTTVTSLRTRSRELGTLRAIGMSTAQMRAMLLLEGLMYGLRALLFGLPAGIGMSALVMLATKGLENWQPPLVQLAIAAVCALALCLLATLLPVGRLTRTSIVEGLGRID